MKEYPVWIDQMYEDEIKLAGDVYDKSLTQAAARYAESLNAAYIHREDLRLAHDRNNEDTGGPL